MIAKCQQALFSERKKDVFLRRKIAVDGAGAVLDLFGNLAHRHIGIALGQKEGAGRAQNGVADMFSLTTVAFLDTHRFRDYTPINY